MESGIEGRGVEVLGFYDFRQIGEGAKNLVEFLILGARYGR
jgi:hypothetical protein